MLDGEQIDRCPVAEMHAFPWLSRILGEFWQWWHHRRNPWGLPSEYDLPLDWWLTMAHLSEVWGRQERERAEAEQAKIKNLFGGSNRGRFQP